MSWMQQRGKASLWKNISKTEKGCGWTGRRAPWQRRLGLRLWWGNFWGFPLWSDTWCLPCPLHWSDKPGRSPEERRESIGGRTRVSRAPGRRMGKPPFPSTVPCIFPLLSPHRHPPRLQRTTGLYTAGRSAASPETDWTPTPGRLHTSEQHTQRESHDSVSGKLGFCLKQVFFLCIYGLLESKTWPGTGIRLSPNCVADGLRSGFRCTGVSIFLDRA